MNLEKYIDKMLTKFKMSDCKPVHNPGDKSKKLSKEQCSMTEKEQRSMKNVPYCELFESLLFATTTLTIFQCQYHRSSSTTRVNTLEGS
jgi:hypothetical protein